MEISSSRSSQCRPRRESSTCSRACFVALSRRGNHASGTPMVRPSVRPTHIVYSSKRTAVGKMVMPWSACVPGSRSAERNIVLRVLRLDSGLLRCGHCHPYQPKTHDASDEGPKRFELLFIYFSGDIVPVESELSNLKAPGGIGVASGGAGTLGIVSDGGGGRLSIKGSRGGKVAGEAFGFLSTKGLLLGFRLFSNISICL